MIGISLFPMCKPDGMTSGGRSLSKLGNHGNSGSGPFLSTSDAMSYSGRYFACYSCAVDSASGLNAQLKDTVKIHGLSSQVPQMGLARQLPSILPNLASTLY